MGKIKATFKKFMKTAKIVGKINLEEKSKVQEKGLEEKISQGTKIFYFSVLFKDCLNVHRVLGGDC